MDAGAGAGVEEVEVGMKGGNDERQGNRTGAIRNGCFRQPLKHDIKGQRSTYDGSMV